MFDALQKLTGLGQRLAEAGRRARTEVVTAAGPVGGEVAAAAAAAAGELVRCAVAGAITALVRGPQRKRQPMHVADDDDLWPDPDELPFVNEMEDLPNTEPTTPGLDVTPKADATENESGWVRGARAVGSALTVAAGAAASVPGGRLVAAGLGAAAAVASLAARVNEPTSEV